MLLARSRRITQDRSEAEDIVHDAFISIRDRAAHYSHDVGAAVAWLMTLVRNLAIDRVRRRDRRAALLRQLAAEQPGRRVESPEALLSTASASAGVRRALSTLPDCQRLTLEAAFFEGLSYPEIADREGVPLGTIKARAARALTSLRVALDADHPRHKERRRSNPEVHDVRAAGGTATARDPVHPGGRQRYPAPSESASRTPGTTKTYPMPRHAAERLPTHHPTRSQ